VNPRGVCRFVAALRCSRWFVTGTIVLWGIEAAFAHGLATGLLSEPTVLNRIGISVHAVASHETVIERASAPKARLLRVGPARELRSISDAARNARDGDTVEIDPGDYVDDVATWPQNGLVIRAAVGRVRMISRGAAAEGKAIWVVKGSDVLIEKIEFSGARVPSRNGGGIRHEGGKLTIRRCLFEHNEIGLMTSNSPSAELDVEGSEFRDNAIIPSQEVDPGHQIYVGRIRRFTLRASYVHRGAVGHLVKSRARENRIYYNRITDEHEGHASYELDFPDGGIAFVMGNIIEQSARSENRAIVSFGAEGYRWQGSVIYLISNTIVDNVPAGGHYLEVAPGGAVHAFNNLFAGPMSHSSKPDDRSGNFRVEIRDLGAADRFDFRLRMTSAVRGLAVDPPVVDGTKLMPAHEYAHPMQVRRIPKGRRSPGALQSLAR
jgi:hypothetical protein